jgi:hypothetical protein
MFCLTTGSESASAGAWLRDAKKAEIDFNGTRRRPPYPRNARGSEILMLNRQDGRSRPHSALDRLFAPKTNNGGPGAAVTCGHTAVNGDPYLLLPLTASRSWVPALKVARLLAAI